MRIALYVVLACSAILWMRSNNRMMRWARESGHRFWLINPLAMFAGLRSIDSLLLVAAAIGLFGSLYLLFPEEAQKLWSDGQQANSLWTKTMEEIRLRKSAGSTP